LCWVASEALNELKSGIWQHNSGAQEQFVKDKGIEVQGKCIDFINQLKHVFDKFGAKAS